MKYLLLALAIYVLAGQIDSKETSQLSSISASPESETTTIITERGVSEGNLVQNFLVKTMNAFVDMYKEQSKVKQATSYTPCFWKICSRPLNKQRFNKYTTTRKISSKISLKEKPDLAKLRFILNF